MEEAGKGAKPEEPHPSLNPTPAGVGLDGDPHDLPGEFQVALHGLVQEPGTQAGVADDRIVLDPGLGFAKAPAHSWELLRDLYPLQALGHPLLLGASRKRMIGALSKEAPVEQRLGGSVALALEGMRAGMQMVRVHDVAETVQARNVWRGLRDAALTDFADLPA